MTHVTFKWAVLQRNDVWEPREQTDPGSCLSLLQQNKAGCRTWWTRGFTCAALRSYFDSTTIYFGSLVTPTIVVLRFQNANAIKSEEERRKKNLGRGSFARA